MAMILNLSIGEEIEPEAKQLEGKAPHDVDTISHVESSTDAAVVADEKTEHKVAEAVV
jgi:hypothetical protein